MPSFVLAKKLRALKKILYNGIVVFGNVGINKKRLLEDLARLDSKEGECGLTDVEKRVRAEVRCQVEHLLSLKEISWKQKLRMLCIKEGDNNTKFFHKIANSHRRYNYLGILEVDGVIYEELSEVIAEVVWFYKNLYQEIEEWRPFVEGLEFEQIGGDREGMA